ncbi:hypothetical protein H8M03_00490 [Sphingomonas sabuli]|uniref:TraB/GumN family protein n=1 Tax=Sphingomonas sabuli TaxID=2764186 RepID=A0A7G9L2N9_9SPHN|nr:DUF5694 domain-containing protein [Sphingomonas sabuli]QNM82888.1 hypothetical protein H8M03_00490 [Sphingomonas sabuli]
MKQFVCGVAAMAIATGAQASSPAAPVQVMVVGTYHFANPGLDLNNIEADDVLTPKRQGELDRLTAELASFKPTKIMVERTVDSAGLADPNFAKFKASDLASNRDERVQIAYRLAARTGAQVFGIDEQPGEGEPDYFPFQAVSDWAASNGKEEALGALMETGAAVAKQIEVDQKSKSIGRILAEQNDPETIERSQQMYYGALAFGGIDKQPGADLNAMWYLRNAKIFAKMQTVAHPGDRIVVVYGAGHNYWLRHFAKTAPGYALIEASPFLKRADP